MPSITTKSAVPTPQRVLQEYDAVRFDHDKRAGSIRWPPRRAQRVTAGAAACIALAVAAVIVFRVESVAVLDIIVVVVASTVIVSVRRSTSFLGGLGSVGDVLLLALQLLLTAFAAYAAVASVWQLLGASTNSGSVAEALFTAG